jgi:hypothetical protein
VVGQAVPFEPAHRRFELESASSLCAALVTADPLQQEGRGGRRRPRLYRYKRCPEGAAPARAAPSSKVDGRQQPALKLPLRGGGTAKPTRHHRRSGAPVESAKFDKHGIKGFRSGPKCTVRRTLQ